LLALAGPITISGSGRTINIDASQAGATPALGIISRIIAGADLMWSSRTTRTSSASPCGARRDIAASGDIRGRPGFQTASSSSPQDVFSYSHQNAEPPEDKYHFFAPNHNLYAVGNTSAAWLRTAQRGVVFATLDAWREATSQDKDSLEINGGANLFVDYAKDDYRPRAGAVTAGVADPSFLKPGDPRQKVDRDFFGVLRSEAKEFVPGAFCATPVPEK
jgi:hypothetical protein